MRRAPIPDFIALWHRLLPDDQAAIGVLAIKEAFLRFAGDDLQGDQPGEGVRYLTPAGQRAARDEADETMGNLTGLIHGGFPDLFGENPSPEHPNGTDPPWAEPIRFRVTRRMW